MLRTIIINDSNQITDIILNCNKDFIKPFLNQSTFCDTLQKIIKYSTFIAVTSQSKIVGYMAFYANDKTTCTAYITLLAVNPDYHNQGVGHKLMQECEKISAYNGMKKIKLAVKKVNKNAIKFYQHRGFEYLCDQDEKSFYMIKTLGERH